MFRLIVPIILIAVAAVLFLTFANPLWQDVRELRAQRLSYDEALSNSKALENERDKLTQKFNAIDSGDLARLEKMLPDNVDNIRLILEIEKVALPYGMGLKDVKYEPAKRDSVPEFGIVQSPEAPEMDNKEYGAWTLEFSTSGTYNNFINFLRDLERNLRIVDVSSITFASGLENVGGNPDIYRYGFKIKTYWLKN